MIRAKLQLALAITFSCLSLMCSAQAGTVDPTFDIGNGADDDIRDISLQLDGRIIIAGDFEEYDFVGYKHLARLMPDGSYDVTFFTNSADQAIYTTEVQTDGNVLIGGVFSNYQSPRLRIARVDDEADIDLTFDPGSGASGIIRDLEVLADGKILVAGNLVTYNDTVVNRITRLHSNGVIDPTFDAGTAFNGNTYSLAVQPDGKIVVGGFFISFNGQGESRIMRLNADGSKDELFETGLGANAVVRRVALQPDGKILIAGGFDSYNGSTANYIARLESDGSLDETFDTGVGADADVYALAVQADGKILIGGAFTEYDGTEVGRLARLNSDGSLDGSFDTGTGAGQPVEDIVIQPDGKILVAGQFTSFNGTSHNRLVRLLGDATDCNGDVDGTAYFDQCGTCVGGDTGLEPCFGGCIDNGACNFDSLAGFDDGSCLFEGDPCDDGDPGTTSDLIQDNCACEGEIATGVREFDLQDLLYPNPASTAITIVPSNGILVSVAQIHDMNGRLLLTETYSGRIVIDVGSLVPGMYTLKIENSSGSNRSKIVISR